MDVEIKHICIVKNSRSSLYEKFQKKKLKANYENVKIALKCVSGPVCLSQLLNVRKNLVTKNDCSWFDKSSDTKPSRQ